MPEIRTHFEGSAAWRARRENLGTEEAVRARIIADVEARGFVEPFTLLRRHPHEIKINHANLKESLTADSLNSRKRALLLQVFRELEARRWLHRIGLRLLSDEGLSRVALIFRGRYPFFLGTEYLPDEASRQRCFPVQHMDLQDIQFPAASFDMFISGDVFEHIPDLNKALAEIVRILKPGGVIVSSFPFGPDRERAVVKASLDASGGIIHHMPPEYHGNPVEPEAGSLVFTLPGWDILEQLKSLGCSDAYFTMIASSRFGITSSVAQGPFILTAVKAGGAGAALRPSERLRL